MKPPIYHIVTLIVAALMVVSVAALEPDVVLNADKGVSESTAQFDESDRPTATSSSETFQGSRQYVAGYQRGPGRGTGHITWLSTEGTDDFLVRNETASKLEIALKWDSAGQATQWKARMLGCGEESNSTTRSWANSPECPGWKQSTSPLGLTLADPAPDEYTFLLRPPTGWPVPGVEAGANAEQEIRWTAVVTYGG